MTSPLVTLNNGNKVPQLGLGVYQTPASDAGRVVFDALELGYRHIDSAAIYGNEREVSESIGKWLKSSGVPRSEVFYTTKIWNADHGYEKAKQAIKVCLEKAKSIDYIDMILIHSPMSDREGRLGTWKALQESVESGKVKNIGISNYGIPHIKELLNYSELTIKPVMNQFELHPWLVREELIKFCQDNDIYVEAYSPLARAKAFGNPTIVSIADKYKVTEAQILIKWSLAKNFITLPKTVSKERLASNLDVFSFELTEDELTKIDSLNSNLLTGWNPTEYPID
ncbi:uncharacterized oxidoreductase [[Candida] jaroonii]|uniref:Uncharacterized oxidoreductase n=1 Tax=[Candida] jaroonii TaxID=467808 RepID=A0ACA9Y599_9ASCO|nr:uncharacterized oxidoreductase [[Candida] jaroonii]